MICRANPYTGRTTPNKVWTNWAATVSRTLQRHDEPCTLADLVEVVALGSSAGQELHALGSGWAFEDAAASQHRMVDLNELSDRLTDVVHGQSSACTDDWRARQANPGSERRLQHFQAGVTIAGLNTALDALGLAMPTLGGANGQTLAGAISTSTHGADLDLPPLPDLVRAIHLVTHGGQELWLERRSDPITRDDRLRPILSCPDVEILRDDGVFDAALVSVGRFGVIYSVVIEVRRRFRLAEAVSPAPSLQVLDLLQVGVQSGLFLDLLLPVLTPPPPTHPADATGPPRAVELIFNSQKTDSCYVRRRWITSDAAVRGTAGTDSFLCDRSSAVRILEVAATALDAQALLIGTILPADAAALRQRALALRAQAADPDLIGGDALASALNAVWASLSITFLGHRIDLAGQIPRLVDMALAEYFKDGLVVGRVGPSYLVMSGTQSGCYKASSIEMVFPADSLNYLALLRQLLVLGPTFRQAGYISVRYSAASNATLSMHTSTPPGPSRSNVRPFAG